MHLEILKKKGKNKCDFTNKFIKSKVTQNLTKTFDKFENNILPLSKITMLSLSLLFSLAIFIPILTRRAVHFILHTIQWKM